jgi:hypothetical protein
LIHEIISIAQVTAENFIYSARACANIYEPK